MDNENTIGPLSQDEKSNLEDKLMSMDPEEIKKLYTKDNPHPTGAYWDVEELKWKGYKAVKGMSPPWVPYSKKRVRTEPNLRERKFMWILSKTGSITEAYRSTYLVKQYDDKRIEAARARANGQNILARIKKNFPDWVKAFSFADITPDFIRDQYMNLFNSPHATIAEKKGILDSMSKIEKLFSDNAAIDIKIREVVNPVYQESDSDFPTHQDDRVGRTGAESIGVYKQPEDKPEDITTV
jgi:hypothetical protein